MKENQVNMSEQIQQRLKEKYEEAKKIIYQDIDTIARQKEQIELLENALTAVIRKSTARMTKAEKLQQIHDIARSALDKLKGGTS
jgi:hypothetical protein